MHSLTIYDLSNPARFTAVRIKSSCFHSVAAERSIPTENISTENTDLALPIELY